MFSAQANPSLQARIMPNFRTFRAIKLQKAHHNCPLEILFPVDHVSSISRCDLSLGRGKTHDWNSLTMAMPCVVVKAGKSSFLVPILRGLRPDAAAISIVSLCCQCQCQCSSSRRISYLDTETCPSIDAIPAIYA